MTYNENLESYLSQISQGIRGWDQRNVLCMPHHGEFGWYCNTYVRKVNQIKADNLVVVCPESHKVYFPNATEFYHDYDEEEDILPFSDKRNKGRKVCGGNWAFYRAFELTQRIIKENPKWEDYHLWRPQSSGLYEFGMDPAYLPDFKPKVKVEVDLVLSVRDLGDHHAFRNSQVQKSHIDQLKEKLPWLRIGIVGTEKGTQDMDVNEYSFKYDDPEDAAVSMLQNCGLAFVENTGVMHLASLCNAPTLVYSPMDMLVGMAARYRTKNTFFRFIRHEGDLDPGLLDFVSSYFEGLPRNVLKKKHYIPF